MSVAAAPRALQPRWAGLVLVAVGSCIAIVAVLLLQAHQLRRLNATLYTGSELRVVEMQHQETEYLHLREQWQRAFDASTPLDLRALTLRYEIWVGRVAMLRDDTALRRTAIGAQPGLDQTLRQVDSFIAAVDAALAGDKPPEARRAQLLSLHPQLVALGEPLHDLVLATGHRITDDQTERHLLTSHYTRVTLALTAALGLLVLAFVGLSAHQMRQLARRQQALQALSEELHVARQAAVDASQAKSRFLANMSHEIRTPFQALLGMLGLLRDTRLDAHQIDCLHTATESADHLLAVLNDILDLSQLEAGRLQINPAAVELRRLLRDVDTLMRPQSRARGLALQIEADADVPAWALLDATRVKQVLFNLLSNAIKFCDEGSIDLRLHLQRDAGDAVQLVFDVTDTGIGMDSATLQRLFGRFERGPAVQPGTPGGTGLGLEISRNLARLMCGDLQARSQPGQGSCFTFTLPLTAVAEPPLPALAPAVAAAPGTTMQPQLQLQLLVAEDHPVNRQVLASLLDGLGHRTLFVADGEQALAAVQRQRFDLVLMDLHMPGLDGIEATRRIRALPDRAAATVPIVALTADAFTDTRERCLVAGMNNFLSKPVNRDKLASLLRQLFGSDAGGPVPQTVADPLDERSSSLRAELDEPAPLPLIDTWMVTRSLQQLPARDYARLLGDYLDQTAQTVIRLRQAVREARPEALRELAHHSRGAALSLGLPALAATAEVLQNGAAHLPAHEVARLVQRFDEQLGDTREAVDRAGLLKATAPATASDPAD